MPYVTQTRNRARPLVPFKHVWDGIVYGIGHVPTGVEQDYQKTYSWRTGPLYDRPDHDPVADASQEGSGLAARRNMNRALRSELKENGRYDTGHEFNTELHQSEIMTQRVVVAPRFTDPRTTRYYEGPLWPICSSESSRPPVPTIPSLDRRNADGREIIKETIPTRPDASLAQLLAEVKERLPNLIGFQTYRQGLGARSTGGEHLNVEFGLKPLKADIEKLARVAADYSARLAQLQADSDKVVHRKRLIRESVTTGPVKELPMTVSLGPINVPAYTWANQYAKSNLFAPDGGMGQSVDLFKSKAWFSGAYSYHLAEADYALNRMREYEQIANKLLGSRITPELIWELTPWSWLIDWWSDMGTLISNATAFSSDGLVLRYGYVMHQTESVRIWTKPLIVLNTGQRVSAVQHFTIRSKVRTRATPYGFGVDMASLSPRRWAILAALGLTKAPGSWRFAN